MDWGECKWWSYGGTAIMWMKRYGIGWADVPMTEHQTGPNSLLNHVASEYEALAGDKLSFLLRHLGTRRRNA